MLSIRRHGASDGKVNEKGVSKEWEQLLHDPQKEVSHCSKTYGFFLMLVC